MTGLRRRQLGDPAEGPQAADLDTRSRVWARSIVHVAVPVLGRLRLGQRALPSFLIVGAQRSGTTSLHRSLAGHPAIATPVHKKGVHYFDAAYPKGLIWYRANFSLATPGVQAMETSPYYLFHPAVPARVATDLPGVKVVVLLRHPVERAVSHHWHETARGCEHLGFEAALEAEEERLAGAEGRLLADPFAIDDEHRHHSYLGRGRYAEQLVRWFAYVDRDRVLVLDSQLLFEGSHRAFGELADFLAIDVAQIPPMLPVNGYQRPELPASVRRRLEEYFHPHDERLTEILGWTPSWR